MLKSLKNDAKDDLDLVHVSVRRQSVDNRLWSNTEVQVQSLRSPLWRCCENLLRKIVDGGTKSNEFLTSGKCASIGEEDFLVSIWSLEGGIGDKNVPDGIYLIGQNHESFLILFDKLRQSLSTEEVDVVDPSWILPKFGFNVDS